MHHRIHTNMPTCSHEHTHLHTLPDSDSERKSSGKRPRYANAQASKITTSNVQVHLNIEYTNYPRPQISGHALSQTLCISVCISVCICVYACVYVCARATSVLVYVCVCSERHTCRYTRNMLRSCGHLLAQPIDRHIQREAINHNSARASAVLYQGLLGSVLTAPIWSGRHPAWMPSVAYLPRNCASATCPAVLSSTMTPLDPGSTRRQCTRLIRH